MNTNICAASGEAGVLARLRENPDLRIVKRVQPLASWPRSIQQQVTRIAVIDTETTGLNHDEDQIIDFAAAMIAVDERGQIAAIEGWGAGLNHPGKPIPPEITRLTGIRGEDVAGQKINADRLAWFVGQAHYCLSHNAAFDRPFVEALCPDIADMPWICSIKDARWRDWGFDSQVLGYLLAQVGLFNEGSHRAMADVVSLVNLLAHTFDDKTTVVGRLLDRAKTPSWRVAATNAPYACKGALKRRGYRWNPREEVWAIEVGDNELTAEQLWLEQLVAPFTRTPTITRLTAHERYRR